MAEISDPGGGSTTTVCTPSPSDNAAILGNLISRISDIEKFLSQLIGADVYANNLSELAVNLGNVLNGTITLPSSTNSPYGVGGSIPVPDGFNGTVVSGNVTTIWTDGVVSFQVDNTGIVAGGSSGIGDYMQVIYSGVGLNGILNWDSAPLSVGSAISWLIGTPSRITINTAGLYHISANIYDTNGSAHTNTQLGIQILRKDSADVLLSFEDGDVKKTQTLATGNVIIFNDGTYFYLNATDRIYLNLIFFTNDTLLGKMTITKVA